MPLLFRKFLEKSTLATSNKFVPDLLTWKAILDNVRRMDVTPNRVHHLAFFNAFTPGAASILAAINIHSVQAYVRYISIDLALITLYKDARSGSICMILLFRTDTDGTRKIRE